jgi:hypothetical protein
MAEDLAVQPEGNNPPKVLSETIMPIDRMYATIAQTLEAVDHTTVGDYGEDLAPELQAHAHSKLLPMTEIEMLKSSAVPMSDADIEMLRQQQARQKSVQYRQKQLQTPTMTLAETTGARIRIAYRLIKYMATIRGIGGMGVLLIQSMASQNAQINLFEIPMPYDPTAGWFRGLTAVRNLLATADEAGHSYSYLLGGNFYKAHGMSILPPPIHDGYYPLGDKPTWQYRREGYTPPNYTADTDGPLATYLNIMELLVRHLGISEKGDELGTGPRDKKVDTYRDIYEQAAVMAMLDPKKARMAWPSRDDIETFEESVFMPYVGRIMANKSQNTTIDTLMKEMGLTHAEALDAVECFKTYAQYVNTFNPEKERSVMLGRLERLAEECNDAGMVTTQLNTEKTKAQILGLTQHAEDSNIDKRAGLESALEAEIVKRSEETKSLPDTPGQDTADD